MSVQKTLLAFLAFLCTVTPSFAADNPRYHRGSHIHSNSPFVRVGGDRVIFGLDVPERCDEQTLKNAAIALKTRSTTDRWDDQWYAFRVSRGKCLLMGWYNLDTAKFGWAAILNKPNSWAVRSNYAGWQDIGNGTQKKYSYKINGQGVDLDIFNPNNEGALTGNDILVSFGY